MRTRSTRRWVVWGSAALLLFLAACGGMSAPTPTLTPPPPTATAPPTATSTTVPTATAASEEPATPAGERPLVFPVKGEEDAPVTIIEFGDYL